MTRLIWRAVALACFGLGGGHVAFAADSYPSRPVRIIVNLPPAGLTDIYTRALAKKMSESLNQPIVIENRSGGDGLIGIRAAKSAPPDGYTLLASSYTIAIQMAVKQEPGYDLLKDFTGIGLIGKTPELLLEGPQQPDKTLADFIARAKASPNQLTYASSGTGSVPHLAAEAFAQQAGIKLTHVPYKGAGAALPDVMSGRVTMILDPWGSNSGKIRAGQLKVLGVTSAMRISAVPDVPTFAEQGVPSFNFYSWICLVAPAGTPKDVVNRLSEALRNAMNSKDIQERYREDGVEAANMTPEELNRFFASEVERLAKLVNDVGIPKE